MCRCLCSLHGCYSSSVLLHQTLISKKITCGTFRRNRLKSEHVSRWAWVTTLDNSFLCCRAVTSRHAAQLKPENNAPTR